MEKTAVNVIDAAAQGAGDGLHLALNIGAMLIAFLALIAMVNGILGWVHTLPLLGWLPPSLEQIFGIVFAPVAWLMGVPWKDVPTIGNLLGTRLVLNEFVAFLKLGPLKAQLDPRSFTIATYALCGFANFSSIAIQIGGIGALAPTRKSDLARLGMRAVAAGTMANFMSACIAGNVTVTEEAKRYIQGHTPVRPPSAWCWAADWARLPMNFPNASDIPYAEIPGWPHSTAVGHAGKLIIGKLGDLDVAVMAGRAHLYEGYTDAQVTYGVRVLHAIGARSMVFTNAAGGINLALERGGLVLISDHINLQGSNPLAGPTTIPWVRAFPICPKPIRALTGTAPNRWPRNCASPFPKACTPPCSARATKRRPRSAICAPSAPTWSACPRCPK